MSARRWFWIYTPEYVGHIVPGGLRRALVADLRARATAPFVIDTIEHLNARPAKPTTVHSFFDLGGMAHADRPKDIYNVVGLRISLPCEQLALIIGALDELAVRTFADGRPYVKLHGFHRALVLTPAMRTAMLAAMRKRLPVAEERSRVFYAERDVPSLALRKANAKVHKVPLDQVPDLGGGHHLERFAPRVRGKA